MRIQLAKRNPVAGVVTIYVPSESNPRKRYNVQRIQQSRKVRYFCNCADFINRHLPHIDTNTFSTCKHGRKAKRAWDTRFSVPTHREKRDS